MKRTLIVIMVFALTLTSLGALTVSASQQNNVRVRFGQEGARGWLGIGVNDIDGSVQIVSVVPDSPAEEAGLAVGDTIVSLNGGAVESARGLVDTVSELAPDEEVSLSVMTDDETREVTVVLAERPAELDRTSPGIQQMFSIIGLTLTLTDEGARVEEIDEGSPFEESDLQAGDVITAINGQPLTDARFMSELMKALQSDEPLTFTVLRDGEEVAVELELNLGAVEAMPMQPGLQQPPTQLGVGYRILTTAVAAEEGLTVEQGALVITVYDDTPAADAGLHEGDIITAVDGDVVDEERTLGDRLYAYEEGDTVTLTVLRDGDEQSVEVTLGPRGPVFGQSLGWGFGPGQSGAMGDWWQGFGREFFENHPWMMPGEDGGIWQFSDPDGSTAPESYAPAVPQSPA